MRNLLGVAAAMSVAFASVVANAEENAAPPSASAPSSGAPTTHCNDTRLMVAGIAAAGTGAVSAGYGAFADQNKAVWIGVGSGLLVTGVVLYVIGSKQVPDDVVALRFPSLVAAPGAVGLGWSGRF